MKKSTLNIFIASALSGLMFTSCDIERFPTGSMSEEQIKGNPEAIVSNLVDGMYAQLKTWSDPMHRLGEYAGDNIMKDKHSTDDFFSFITYNRTPNNGRLQQFWDYGYKAIAQASNAIQMLDDINDEKYSNSKGECYYVRGMMYFYLTRAFGRPYYQAPTKNLGVPIVNGTPSEEELDNLHLPDRSTVEESYKQAINDLRIAESLLTEDKGPAYASKKAAQAMLSKVYLFMSGTYENPNIEFADSARWYANEVINAMPDALATREDYMKSERTTPENYKESIFVVKRLAAEFPGFDYYYGIGGMYSNIGGMGWGEMYASAKYLDLLNETGLNDWRPDSKIIVDARAHFIEPKYSKDDKDNYIPVLRFIVKNDYGYVYRQLKVDIDDNICWVGDREKKDESYKEYTIRQETDLSKVSYENERYYTIDYEGTKYTNAVLDYQMDTSEGHPMFYIVKCSREDGLESQLHSPIISRLDEMYLNRAEAYVKLGKISEAMADVNLVRGRAIVNGEYSDTEFTAVTAPELVDKERQLELAYQAERSYDVFRNGKSLTREYPGPHNAFEEVKATDYRVTYYIPQTAINSYPSGSTLTQNPTDNSGVILN